MWVSGWCVGRDKGKTGYYDVPGWGTGENCGKGSEGRVGEPNGGPGEDLGGGGGQRGGELQWKIGIIKDYNKIKEFFYKLRVFI